MLLLPLPRSSVPVHSVHALYSPRGVISHMLLVCLAGNMESAGRGAPALSRAKAEPVPETAWHKGGPCGRQASKRRTEGRLQSQRVKEMKSTVDGGGW
jgi:hypothetical protein